MRRHRASARTATGFVALALAVALATAACGLGDKERHAKLISASRRDALGAESAKATLRVEMVPTERPLGVDVPETEEGQDPPVSLWIDVAVDFDFAAHRAHATIPAAAGAEVPLRYRALFFDDEGGDASGAALEEALGSQAEQPADPGATTAPADTGTPGVTIFANTIAFAKRTTLRPTEKRVWAKLDYRRLNDDEPGIKPDGLNGVEMLQAVAGTVNAHFLLDMVVGVLAGSVEIVGEEKVGDTAARHYRANVSLEKVISELDLSDRQLESRNLTFRLLGIPGSADVNPADIWLDGEGRLRRFRIVLPQVLRRDLQNDLVLTLEMAEYDAPVEVAEPGPEEVIEVDRYGRLIRAGLPLAPEA